MKEQFLAEIKKLGFEFHLLAWEPLDDSDLSEGTWFAYTFSDADMLEKMRCIKENGITEGCYDEIISGEDNVLDAVHCVLIRWNELQETTEETK